MGHYASEMGIGPSLEEMKRDERVEKMQELLRTLPLSRFSADFVYDIYMVYAYRQLDYRHKVEDCLDRLEAFLVSDIKE